MAWTKAKLAEAKRTLQTSISVEDAGAKLGVSRHAIRRAFKRAGLKEPRTFLPALERTLEHKQRVIVPKGMVITSVALPIAEAHDSIPHRLICDGDLHYPIHDPYVEAAKLKFAQHWKPDMWVNLGDAYDFWPISRHEKEPERWFDGSGRLQTEFDAARPYWKEVCRISKTVKLLLGNHENRLYKFIGSNLGLFNLKAFEWNSLAGLPDKVQVAKYGTQLRVGPVTFEHGDQIGGRFGVKHPEAWILDNKGNRNTVFGHTHRAGIKCRTVYDENGTPHMYTAINQGHGMKVSEQHYSYEPSWQHGFTAIEYWTDKGKPRFSAHLILIVDGQFSFDGRIYDGRK